MAEKKTVLLVDDEPWIRDSGQRSLKLGGFAVLIAVNGQDALDQLANFEVDIIVTDIDMPVITGIELIKSVREAGRNVPFIAMSGRADDPALVKELRALNVAEIIVKPFSWNDVMMPLIKKLIG